MINKANWNGVLGIALISLLILIFRAPEVEFPTMEQVVEANNYRLISYTITTDDGYFLTLQRIVPKIQNTTSGIRKPVLIVPGMFVSAAVFVFQPPGTSGECSNIVFCLLNSGRYDVWIANLRGTLLSDQHVNGSRNPTYWDYSFEEMAVYDLPASIDYIKQETGSRQKIAMLGYSMGGTIQGIFMTMKPEYSSQIHPYVAWSPAVILDNSQSFLDVPRLFPRFPYAPLIRFGLDLVHHRLRNFIIRYTPEVLIELVIGQLSGPTGSYNISSMPYFWKLSGPSGESSRVLEHYLSIVINRKFVQFGANRHLRDGIDPRENFREYPWANIPKNLTMLVMYGASDTVVTPIDARKFVSILNDNGVNAALHRVKSDNWNHFNFVTGSEVDRLVNNPTLRFLDQHY